MFSVRHQPPKGFANPKPINEIFKVQKKTDICSIIDNLCNKLNNPTAKNLSTYNCLGERKEMLGNAFDELFSRRLNSLSHVQVLDFSATSAKEGIPLDLRLSVGNVTRISNLRKDRKDEISNKEVQTDDYFPNLVQQKSVNENCSVRDNLESPNGNTRNCCCQNLETTVRHLVNNPILKGKESSLEGLVVQNVYFICKHSTENCFVADKSSSVNISNDSIINNETKEIELNISHNVNSPQPHNNISINKVSSSTNPPHESNKMNLQKKTFGSKTSINDILDDMIRNQRVKMKLRKRKKLQHKFMRLRYFENCFNRSPLMNYKKKSKIKRKEASQHVNKPINTSKLDRDVQHSRSSVIKSSTKESQQHTKIPEKLSESSVIKEADGYETDKVLERLKIVNKQTESVIQTHSLSKESSSSDFQNQTSLGEERDKKTMLHALGLITFDEKLLHVQKKPFVRTKRAIIRSPVYAEESSSADECGKFSKRKRRLSDSSYSGYKRKKLNLLPKKYFHRRVNLTHEYDIESDDKFIENSLECNRVPVIKPNPEYISGGVALNIIDSNNNVQNRGHKNTGEARRVGKKFQAQKNEFKKRKKEMKTSKRSYNATKNTSSKRSLKMRIFKDNCTHKAELL